jgi:LysR family transcriptional regulator, transcriptional activator of the cysJI operon
MVFDFRLQVFYKVAQKLSFTKAAQELFITQPAVTKHIKELEQQLGVGLLKRHGNRISLTPAGIIMEKYAQKIFQTYAALENELAQLGDMPSGHIRIGASTTLAQYVLPQVLAAFRTAHPALHFSFQIGNTGFIEEQVIEEKLDIAVVEGNSHHPELMYSTFVKDEIVLVTRTSNKKAPLAEIKPDLLKILPLVLRESGSGTLDVVYQALALVNLHPKDLHPEILLENTESIKQYLRHTDCFAFLSIHAIAQELIRNELRVIDILGTSIYRTFQFVQLHGQASPSTDLFKRFCLRHYNLK